ncbi:MAG: LysR family transcriptional regulator [Pseudomonadota bacterium]
MASGLSTEQLETLLMVVRFGGIRRASEHMHLSQPAVTARIQKLEQTLGTAVFERVSGRLVLTKRGEALVRYAEQHAQLNQMILRDVAEPADIDLHLRLGVSETIVQAWLPDFVACLRSAYPKLAVDISVDISVNLREALLNRSLDLAILMGPVSEFSVDNVAVPDFPLGWFAPTSLDLPDDPAALFRSTSVVTYARNTRPYRELRTALLERYGPGISMFPSSSLSACFRLVAAGLGVGALPHALAHGDLAAGRIRAFDPGWTPDALRFTASYVADPPNTLAAAAARIAADVAHETQSIENSDRI